MSQSVSLQPAENKNWRNIFILLSVLILVIMPALSHSYGQTGDEWIQIDYGQFIWDYFFKGDTQALDFTNKQFQYSHQEYYGGIFDFPMTVLHHWFPSIGMLTLRHFFNAILGAFLMVFTGLLGYRLTKKWSVGVIALLFIIFSPRIFGEGMNNPKDIPFATGFTMAMFFLVSLLVQTPRKFWRNVIGLGLGWGLAFGLRAAGGMLFLAYLVLFTALYYILNKDWKATLQQDNNKLLKKLLLGLFIGVALGYIIGLSAWPWGMQSPISNPLESLKGMANREVSIRVLFEGQYYRSDRMPWYYEFKWIFISNPVIVLLGTVLFVLLSLQVKKRYGTFVVIVLLFSALFPLLYMIYKHSTVYDSWRHVFFVYPYWVIMGAIGIDMIGQFVKNPKLNWLPQAIAIVGLLPAIIWTFRSHPNQGVYFNELEGGVKGAYGNYDIDYYQNSGYQAAQWIQEHAKPVPGRKIIVLSNLSGFYKYFLKDTAWMGVDYQRWNNRHVRDYDYYVAYPRFVATEQLASGAWPPANATVHKVEVDGVPLCVVVQQKSKDGIAAAEAFEKKDYATAAQKYGTFVQADNSDENAFMNYAISLASIGQIDAGIQAIQRATQLDPSRPEFFQILAQLYQAKGDMGNAQQAMNQAQAIMMKEQEED